MPSLLSKIKNKLRGGNTNASHKSSTTTTTAPSKGSKKLDKESKSTVTSLSSKAKKSKGGLFKKKNKNENNTAHVVTSPTAGKKVGVSDSTNDRLTLDSIEEKENHYDHLNTNRSKSPNSTASPPFFDDSEDPAPAITTNSNSGTINIAGGAWNIIPDSDLPLQDKPTHSTAPTRLDRQKMVQRSLIDLDSSFEDDATQTNSVPTTKNMVEFQDQYQFQPYRNYQLSSGPDFQDSNDLFGSNPIAPTLDSANLTTNNPNHLLPSPTESTDFCLSTDVEDDEYNKIRHNTAIAMQQPNPLGIPASPSSDDNQSTEEGYGLFPSLMDNVAKPPTATHDKITITPMAHETEEDLRAWTPSPRHAATLAVTNHKKNLFTFDDTDGNAGSRTVTGKVMNKNLLLQHSAMSNHSSNEAAHDVFIEPSADSDFESIGPLAGEALLATSIESNDSFQNDDNLLYPSPKVPFNGISLADGLSPSSTTDKESPICSPSNTNVSQSSVNKNEPDKPFFEDPAWSASQPPDFKKQNHSSSNRSFSPEKKTSKLPPSLSDTRRSSLPSSNTSAQIPQHPRSLLKENAGSFHSGSRGHRPTSSSSNNIIPPASPNLNREGSSSAVKQEKIKRKKRRKDSTNSRHHHSTATHENPNNSDNSSSNDDPAVINEQENWLFDEVTGALGPRGITADLESLGGRSQRSKGSKTSTGNKSHRSSRSHRSHRSHKSTSSRRSGARRSRHTAHDITSGGSVGSRNSHISHRSSRSHLSHMTEASRSVANDLLRLEMQLAMVGGAGNAAVSQIAAVGVGHAENNSVGGNSRASYTSNAQYYSSSSVGNASRGTSRKSTSNRTSSTATNTSSSSSHHNSTRRSKITITAPPGKLGIILANKFDTKGTVISGVRSSSVLINKLHPGDRLISVDGEDVSRMTVAEITTIMARKNDFERTLVVLTTNLSHSSRQKQQVEGNAINHNNAAPIYVKN